MRITELSQLRQLLVDHYSEGGLRTLCFDLGVDYEIIWDVIESKIPKLRRDLDRILEIESR